MKFSIIVPVYNIEIFIEQCINSIISQSFPDFEVILINDGSTDTSGEKCEQLKKLDNRINVVHQNNGGVSIARNNGIKKAKGDYLLFVDGDDYLNNNALEKLNEIIIYNNFPDFIYNSSVYCIMPKGKKFIKTFEFYNRNIESLRGEDALIEFLQKVSGYPWSIWGNIYKRNIIIENKIDFKNGVTLGEDADWLFRFILNSESNKIISFPFYNYRINRPNSAMNIQSYNNLVTYLNIVENWVGFSEINSMGKLKPIIQSKLSNNYLRYFKYIYSLKKHEREDLIKRLEKINLLQYNLEPQYFKLKRDIEKKGYQKTLKRLNTKYVFKEKLKKNIVYIGLLDR